MIEKIMIKESENHLIYQIELRVIKSWALKKT